MRIIFLLLLLSAVPAHAYTDQEYFDAGNKALAESNFTTAKKHFIQCAKHRTGCMTQMGVTSYRAGDMDDAIAWFNLAASYGDETAISNLKNLGQPIPAIDKSMSQQGAGSAAIDIMNALLQGYSRSGKKKLNCESIIIGDVVDTECSE